MTQKKVELVHVRCVDEHDYWASVTDVPCLSGCGGFVRWAEAGYVPGYRICDKCDTAWFAAGNLDDPQLAPATMIEPGIVGPAAAGEKVAPYRRGARDRAQRSG